MRVLIDATLVRNYNTGFGRYIKGLYQGFVSYEENNDFEIWLAVEKTKSVLFDDRPPIKIIPVSLPAKFGYYAGLFSPALRQFSKKVDLWHSPVSCPPLGVKVKTVITVHDVAWRYYPWAYTRASLFYWKEIFERMLRKTAMVIAVSENTRQDIVRLIGVDDTRVATVYNALCLPALGSLTRDEEMILWKIPEKYVLYVGAFNPRKNIPTLIAAFGIIKRDTELPHKLVLCGGGAWNEVNITALLTQCGVSKDVIILKNVSDSLLTHIYMRADVFVYPSLYEGFGYPPLEAMAYGVPVIASNAPPLPEILGDAAYYFDPHNPGNLAKAIIEVVTRTSVAEHLRRAGHERTKLFTLERMIKGTLEAYRCAYEA